MFHYWANEISLSKMDIVTQRTNLHGDLALEFDSISDFKDFSNKVKLKANFTDASRLSSSDLIAYIPSFPNFKTIGISGSIDGPLNAVEAKELELRIGSDTRLKSDLKLINPTRAESIYIEAENLHLNISVADAQEFFPLFSSKSLPKQLEVLGKVWFDGNFEGFLNNFKSEGILITDIGEVDMDLFFNNQDSLNVAYNGDVEVSDLDLGRLLEDSIFGKLSASMNLSGKGLTPAEMNTKLLGEINAFEYKGYKYVNANVDGKILEGDFQGDFKVNDPNLKFDFKGKASLSKDISSYDFVASIDTANLLALKLTKDSITNISTELDINFRALNYDKWKGNIKVTKTTIENVSDFYFFKDILIKSNSFEDTNKFLTVESNILDAHLNGSYTLKGVSNAMLYHFRKFLKDPGGEKIIAPNEDFEFDLHIKNTRVLSEIFLPDLYMESNSKANGTYKGKTKELEIAFNSPGFKLKQNELTEVDLKYYGQEKKTLLGLSVEKTELKNGLLVDSLTLGNQLIEDTLFFDFKWVVKDSIGSKTFLKGFVKQDDTVGYHFGIADSDFNIGDRKFSITEENKIFVDNGRVQIQDLIISGTKERITINGNLSKNPNEILRVGLENFDMGLVNYFLRRDDAKFAGNISGGLILSQALSTPRFALDLDVDSLKLNGLLFGDLRANSDWDYNNDSIRVSTTLKKGSIETVSIDGLYLATKSHGIDLNLRFDQFGLAAFNPFVSNLVENLRGNLAGDLKIKGRLSKPKITGELELPRVAATVGILQTDYNFSNNPVIQIEENQFKIKDLSIRDTRFGTSGLVNGVIKHNNFSDFVLDLDIQANELLALNTTIEDNEAYYGRAFISGLVSFDGTPGDMIIKANVSAKRNSKFYLPLDGATEVSRSDYVVFVSPEATEEEVLEEEIRKLNSQGLSLDFNIGIDQSSEVQLIIDQQTGTKLRAVGEGNVRIKINPRQEVQMFGTYTATEGEFLLSLENVIKKKFIVERGGTVSWNGSPTEALVNISAIYQTRSDPSPLVPDYEGGRTLINLKLNLSGELQNLNKSFVIEAPRANSTTQTSITNRLSDEDKMNQQVFSLLAMDAFLPDQGISGGEFVSNSANAFDFLASQASNWINQATGDYNVSLSYQNATANRTEDDVTINSQEEVEVGVSKRFFDDRVTINGRVGVALGENQRENQVAGDFEVEYNITEDGRFRTKAFNRSVQDQFSFTEQNYQQGVGVFYQVDFNTWSELIDSIFSRKDSSKSQERENPPAAGKKEEEEAPTESTR